VPVGYNMALNLQSKLPSSDTIIVYDINTDSVTRFAAEVKSSSGAKVEVATSPAEAAEGSVSYVFQCCSRAPSLSMMSLFYP
jgi:hypothetical protein